MLDVYTYRIPKPVGAIDFSILPLDEWAAAAMDVVRHQTNAEIWLGYFEGWMLTPREEVLMRPLLRKFRCQLVTAFPLSLSQSWKNECGTIYTAPLNSNGDANSNDNGGAVQYGGSHGHGKAGSDPSIGRDAH